MNDEIKSMHNNETQVLVLEPERSKLIDCKWMYKLKEGLSSTKPPRFKVGLVAKGFTQKGKVLTIMIYLPLL